jgi:hypothetical protein
VIKVNICEVGKGAAIVDEIVVDLDQTKISKSILKGCFFTPWTNLIKILSKYSVQGTIAPIVNCQAQEKYTCSRFG